jgi:hypothetical protein
MSARPFLALSLELLPAELPAEPREMSDAQPVAQPEVPRAPPTAPQDGQRALELPVLAGELLDGARLELRRRATEPVVAVVMAVSKVSATKRSEQRDVLAP